MYKQNNIRNHFKLFKLSKYIEEMSGAFIAGGCFKDIFTGKPVRDVDIFFKDKFSYERGLELYSKKVEEGGYILKYENENCTAFQCKKGVVIELIKSIFGTPEHIMNNFDFTVVKFAQEYREKTPDGELVDNKIIHHIDFFEHLHTKKLVIDELLPVPKPISTANRVLKYTRYGFNLCRGSKVRLLQSLISIPQETLENQLNQGLYGGWD